ncbi:MAG TPA: TRAP transporter small permease subunit, partial [Roseiflexaceae bacterium]|nr:TRAP transporter small permease subunit [Roseiflexaceae bacterium]
NLEMPMRALLRISQVIDAVTEWIGNQLPWLVTILVAIGFINVVARYLGRFVNMRLTSNAVIETQWYLFTVLFFLGFAYILKHNLNVRVDFLYANFSPKQRALIDLIGHSVFFLAFCILGISVSYLPVMKSWGLLPNGSWGTWEMSPDPDGLPRAPIKSMIIVAFVMLFFQTISEIIKNIAILRGAASPDIIEQHAGHDALAEAE